MSKTIQVLLLIISSAGLGFGDIMFTLSPVGGEISGSPGETIGWGFTVSNANSDYAVITSATYLNDPSQGSVVGSFTDFISPQFVVIGPTDGFVTPSFTQDFSLALQEGTGSFVVDPAAVVGAHSGGSIQLTYDLYTVDPYNSAFDPGPDLESSGNIVSATASIDVTATQTTTTTSGPEPWSITLLATVLASVLFLHRRSKADVPRAKP